MATKEQVDAKKSTMKFADAKKLLSEVNEVYAAKGKRVVHLDLRVDTPDDEQLKSLLLGPTGNLRAPTLRRGKVLVVGFDPDTYHKVFG